MAEIRKGFSWASLVCFILLLAVIGYLVWQSTNKTDTENYSKGATHNETTTNISPVQNLYPLAFPGCSPFIRIDNPTGKGPVVDIQKKDVKK